ncbi:hypothetical protein [Sulfitobacter aestuariivivens]
MTFADNKLAGLKSVTTRRPTQGAYPDTTGDLVPADHKPRTQVKAGIVQPLAGIAAKIAGASADRHSSGRAERRRNDSPIFDRAIRADMQAQGATAKAMVPTQPAKTDVPSPKQITPGLHAVSAADAELDASEIRARDLSYSTPRDIAGIAGPLPPSFLSRPDLPPMIARQLAEGLAKSHGRSVELS